MDLPYHENVSLAKYTTLGVGGPAKYLVEVKSLADLKMAGRFALQTGLPFFVIGSGSNLLIADEGYDGLIIYNKIKGKKYNESIKGSVELVCGAGEELDAVIKETVEKNFWGLENLSAIPGTIGATPVQNVGAYGVEVADLITGVETYHIPSDTCRTFKNVECDFHYRDSFFKSKEGKEYVITSVTFRLSTAPWPRLEYADLKNKFSNSLPTQADIRKEIINIRANKFPDWNKVGTAGSFFKNPIVTSEKKEQLKIVYPELPVYETKAGYKISLGFVLDKICGLKGFKEGDIELFSKQALVLVNHGTKNTNEVKRFVEKISQTVYEKIGVDIEPEVFYLE